MLTGSLAMAVYAEPRMTRDIDLLVECEGRTPEDLVELFHDVCYISEDAVREALAAGGIFNIIHLEGVSKADFVVRRPKEYRRTAFARRRFMDIGGREIPVVAPEDLIGTRHGLYRALGAAPGRPRPAEGAHRMTRDTTHAVRTMYRDMLMSRPPGERLAAGCRMFATARTLALAGLTAAGEAGGHSLRARLFLRLYGRDFDPAERRRIVERLDRLDSEDVGDSRG